MLRPCKVYTWVHYLSASPLVKIVQNQGISVRNLVSETGWKPALVDACILEPRAFEAISQTRFGDDGNASGRSLNNMPGITAFTRSFAEIVSFPAG